jgi:hypothetical protein
MKFLKYSCGALIVALLASCGGSSGSNAGSSTTHSFVTPKMSSQQIYADTTLDNSNNTINQTTRNTITAVNADGSYVYTHDDPNNNSLTVNGTTYSTQTRSITDNNSGQELSYSYTPANGAPVACTVAPHGAGPNFPLTVGQNWTLNYAITCGTTAPVSYTQTGTVVGVESVTVPAGTFSAIKLQSTLTWTTPNGTTRTETITAWRDVNTEIQVKRVTNIVYSGTALVNGYPVTTTTTLESQS